MGSIPYDNLKRYPTLPCFSFSGNYLSRFLSGIGKQPVVCNDTSTILI